MKRILFIGHEAERTGAPIVLLHLLRWIAKNRPDFGVEILLLRDGELRGAYEEVAKLHIIPPVRLPEIVSRGLAFLRRRLRVKKRLRVPQMAPFLAEYDLVVGNTVASLEYLEYFKNRGCKTVCWLHEMRSIIDSFFPEPDRFRELTDSVDMFVVASRAVEAVLREFGATSPASVVYEFSELDEVDPASAAAVRQSLNIPDSAFVVGGSGTVSKRKGTDLFLKIAEKLTQSIDDIYFVWVGGPSRASNEEYEHAVAEMRRLGIKRVFITGAQAQPQNYFSNVDVFALTSREDPFPLVCLEAASLSQPVICFEGAGGMPEFVGEDGGAVVPFGDVDAFALRIEEFYRDRRRLRTAGDAAYRKVTNDFSLESSCKKLCDVFDEVSRLNSPTERE